MKRNHYLNRHGAYVDHRIAILCGAFARNTAEEFSPSGLLNYLMDRSDLPELMDSDEGRALGELKDLLHRWDILRHGDLLGYVYQEIQSRGTRKKYGRYFTPRDTVDYIIKHAISNSNGSFPTKLLDPACGSGQFLIRAYAHMAGNLDRSAHRDDKKQILGRLYGIDSDPVAAEICKWNLSRVSGVEESEIINIYKINYLFNTNIDESPEINGPFDVVMGNPPWGSALNDEDRRTARKLYSCTRSGLNTFTLFIERTAKLLSVEGMMAFLLPEAYLNIGAHSESRRHVLEHMRILDIASWGERFKGVFAPAISFIAVREDSRAARERHVVRISSPVDTGTSTLVPQAHYIGTPGNIFNIHYSRRAVELISRMEEKDCRYLKGAARFFLGVVTGDNPKYLHKTPSESAPDPIIIGRDLEQYRINYSGHYFKYDPSVLQQLAPMDLYKSPVKLLYRFIGRRLIFAIDREGRYSLNNVNALIPDDPSFEPEYLMALLNSRLMQYYYEKNFFTVKVLRGNLERLPLRPADSSTRKKIKALVDDVTDSPVSPSGENARETIEDMVFGMYGIGDAEAAHISDLTTRAALN